MRRQCLTIRFVNRRSYTPLYVIYGESNSGGLGANSDIPDELSPNPKVQIWDNTGGGFANLEIGVNNNLGHNLLPPIGTHGLERSIAIDTVAGTKSYIVKGGQGGSRIDEWAVGAVGAAGYYQTLKGRVEGAKAAMRSMGLNPRPIFVFWLGLNDIVNDDFGPTWPTRLAAHLAQIRSDFGQEWGGKPPIFLMGLMATDFRHIIVNGFMESMADDRTFFVDVSAADNALEDQYHWNTAGLRIIGGLLKEKMKAFYGNTLNLT